MFGSEINWETAASCRLFQVKGYVPPHTDLVIQIATAKMAANSPDTEALVAGLRQTLRPGVEIALVYRGYMATTSILWLEGPLADHSLRAGVRLLGLSVLPARYSRACNGAGWNAHHDTLRLDWRSPLLPPRLRSLRHG